MLFSHGVGESYPGSQTWSDSLILTSLQPSKAKILSQPSAAPEQVRTCTRVVQLSGMLCNNHMPASRKPRALETNEVRDTTELCKRGWLRHRIMHGSACINLETAASRPSIIPQVYEMLEQSFLSTNTHSRAR